MAAQKEQKKVVMMAHWLVGRWVLPWAAGMEHQRVAKLAAQMAPKRAVPWVGLKVERMADQMAAKMADLWDWTWVEPMVGMWADPTVFHWVERRGSWKVDLLAELTDCMRAVPRVVKWDIRLAASKADSLVVH